MYVVCQSPGLDYHSYYSPSCEPPSSKGDGCGGCPGCGPPTVNFNETLDWLKNYSMLVDGLPMTPILVGWQGNGHDSLYPGLDVVNSYLGGSKDLNKLVAVAKQLYNATMSYHIDVDISNSMMPTEHYEGPYQNPSSPYDASVPNPEFELSSMVTNADHQTPWCMNNTYWTMFWPMAGEFILPLSPALLTAEVSALCGTCAPRPRLLNSKDKGLGVRRQVRACWAVLFDRARRAQHRSRRCVA